MNSLFLGTSDGIDNDHVPDNNNEELNATSEGDNDGELEGAAKKDAGVKEEHTSHNGEHDTDTVAGGPLDLGSPPANIKRNDRNAACPTYVRIFPTVSLLVLAILDGFVN